MKLSVDVKVFFMAALSLRYIAADTVTLVKDITPGLPDTNPTWLTVCHGYLYFELGEDSFFSKTRPQLHRFHGPTNTSTSAFTDGEDRHALTCFKNNLYYFRSTDSGSFGLYKFDGTSETLMYDTESKNLRDVEARNGVFREFQSELYFGLEGPKLAKTDGETVKIAWDLQSGWYATVDQPRWLTVHQDELFFITDNGNVEDKALWKFNGTKGILVEDLALTTGNSYYKAGWFTSFKDDLYFMLGDYPSLGSKLVKWNGKSITVVGAFADRDGGRSPSWLTVMNNELYMKIYDVDNLGRKDLYKFDGEQATLVAELDLYSEGWLTAFNGNLYFQKSDETIPDPSVGLSTQLYKTDGSKVEVVGATFPFAPQWLTPYQGRLFLSGGGDGTGHELFVVTPEGWKQPANVFNTQPGKGNGTQGSNGASGPENLNGNQANDGSPASGGQNTKLDEEGGNSGTASGNLKGTKGNGEKDKNGGTGGPSGDNANNQGIVGGVGLGNGKDDPIDLLFDFTSTAPRVFPLQLIAAIGAIAFMCI